MAARLGMMGSLNSGFRNTSPTAMAPAGVHGIEAFSPGKYSSAARAPLSPYTAGRQNLRLGLASSKYSSYINPLTNPDQGGVVAGRAPSMNAVQQAQAQGPSLAEIQAEMKRREVGAQLNANPANSALAGYMMGQ